MGNTNAKKPKGPKSIQDVMCQVIDILIQMPQTTIRTKVELTECKEFLQKETK